MAAFREIRRHDRALSEHEAREILARAEYGVLATVGDDGWPYAVPLNHVLAGDLLYIHCALEGHKLDNLANEPRVCYCAVAGAQVIPDKLSTLYESAIAFGEAALVTDTDEKNRALKFLTDRFCADYPDAVEEAQAKFGAKVAVLRLKIERITGKAHRE
jgi:nitroimidazol reductase NimA-like FMN-containing flavoprotein (pyridoxamine 5'-phosphate oxidase superfamily)